MKITIELMEYDYGDAGVHFEPGPIRAEIPLQYAEPLALSTLYTKLAQTLHNHFTACLETRNHIGDKQ